ncbi:MAG: HAD family hydrolase [Anaerolineae bacterium]
MFDLIAFDADDTLWDNEGAFAETQDRLRELLAPYLDTPLTTGDLYAREQRNLALFGYGVKGFALSMIETAIELTGGRVTGADIQVIVDLAKGMLTRPIRLLEQVEPTIATLAASHRLMLITKGDLFEQETKIARSGLADYFTHVEIVSEKNELVYRRLFDKHGIDVRRVLMVGNSLRSDVLPIVALGGCAVHIPYALTWVHELAHPDIGAVRNYHELEHIGQLPTLIQQLEFAHP